MCGRVSQCKESLKIFMMKFTKKEKLIEPVQGAEVTIPIRTLPAVACHCLWWPNNVIGLPQNYCKRVSGSLSV